MVAGVLVALLAYGFLLWQPTTTTTTQPTPVVPTNTVAVPQLDAKVLAEAKDERREQRLVLEPAPLQHLLAKSLDVGPTVAAALGLPEQPIDVATVRRDLARLRWRWLAYEGELEELSAPRAGHPVRGHSIHEATLKLSGGERVLFAFSEPPPSSLVQGAMVRAEGFLLKLRDTTYPQAIDRAPMLVGRRLQRTYPPWEPVTSLDTALFAGLDDTTSWPGDLACRTIDEDQTPATWHLAAFARDSAAGLPDAYWHAAPALTNAVHERLVAGDVARGTAFRIRGTVVQRSTLIAPPNPAGIAAWTVLWLQVREYGGGVLVPIWLAWNVPELPERSSLEVHGLWYRWQAYETVHGDRRRAPLFVAAATESVGANTPSDLGTVTLWLAAATVASLGLVFWLQRRANLRTLRHARDLDDRRRRRASAAPRATDAAD